MKKLIAVTLLLVTLCCSLLTAAGAESVSGSTAGGVTFTVHSNGGSSSYIVLTSSTGLASVQQHNWYGKYTGTDAERHHGFYRVDLMRGGKLLEQLFWAPSATANKDNCNLSTCREIQLKLRDAGDYKISVTPISVTSVSYFWRVDTMNYWIKDATWTVSITSGCRILN